MKKISVIIFLLFICIMAFSEDNVARHVNEKEELFFSFKISNSEKIVSILETADKQIVYRFGKPNKVELEYPDQEISGDKVFTLRWYMRPSMNGTNEGLTQLRFEFLNNGYKYKIYYDYYDPDNLESVGIKIFNPQGKQIAELSGYEIIGSLLNLMGDDRILIEQIPGGE